MTITNQLLSITSEAEALASISDQTQSVIEARQELFSSADYLAQ